VILDARIPQNVEDWALAFRDMFSGIVDRLFTLLTSCPERRIAEYDRIPWWTFIEAASHAAAYQTLLGKGLTRSLVAVRAQEGSTRTVGYTLLQLLFGLLTYGGVRSPAERPDERSVAHTLDSFSEAARCRAAEWG
jgi:15-cis-phytoene desaturase